MDAGKNECMRGGMQERRDEGKGGRQERREEGKEAFRTEGIQEGGIQVRMDLGKEGCMTGEMLDRRDT